MVTVLAAKGVPIAYKYMSSDGQSACMEVNRTHVEQRCQVRLCSSTHLLNEQTISLRCKSTGLLSSSKVAKAVANTRWIANTFGAAKASRVRAGLLCVGEAHRGVGRPGL